MNPPPPACTLSTSAELDIYYSRIRNEDRLTADQERSLAEAIARGDNDARTQMIRANLRLVVKIARGYMGRGLPLEDLVGEGNIGLIRATEEYDPTFGTRFSTYAGYWIRQAIGQALMNTAATIRLPSHVVVLLGRWRRTERRLRRELGTSPDPDQVAEALGLTSGQRSLIERGLHSRRMGQAGSDDGFDERYSRGTVEAARDPHAPPEAALEAAEECEDIYRRMIALDDRERAVLHLRYGLGGTEPRTLKEVGRHLGVTREWVRKIELRALRKLGSVYESSEEDFLNAIREYGVTKARGYPSWDEVMQVADAMGFTKSSRPA
jgi:RNA polymerase primary sigma factor